MNTVVFTVFGIGVSVKNIIGGVILAAIFALCSYAVGFVIDGFVIDAKHKVTAGFIVIASCVGVVVAIFWLTKFIGYCFS